MSEGRRHAELVAALGKHTSGWDKRKILVTFPEMVAEADTHGLLLPYIRPDAHEVDIENRVVTVWEVDVNHGLDDDKLKKLHNWSIWCDAGSVSFRVITVCRYGGEHEMSWWDLWQHPPWTGEDELNLCWAKISRAPAGTSTAALEEYAADLVSRLDAADDPDLHAWPSSPKLLTGSFVAKTVAVRTLTALRESGMTWAEAEAAL